MKQYPHFCRDGHDEVGFNTDKELCPVCEALNEVEFLKRENERAKEVKDTLITWLKETA